MHTVLLRKPAIRRALALALVVLGALLMFLAPETSAGAILLALGVAIELAGFVLRHRSGL
jgi:membrane-bound ClpP family serine protease